MGSTGYGKSHLRIFDITNETSPTLVPGADYISSADATVRNDFLTTLSAHRTSDSVAWFYYTQPTADPCTTNYQAATSTNYLGGGWSTQNFGSSFPTARIWSTGIGGGFAGPGDGLGDYNEAINHGIANGRHYSTFAKPVPATGPDGGTNGCVYCLGNDWGMRVFGAEVQP
jgi:hypothetical protein